MALTQVTIDDVEVYPLLQSFKIGWRRGGRAVANFTLKSRRLESGVYINTVPPDVGMSVGFFYNGDRHWSGTIEVVRDKAKTNKRYDITCTSLEQILDRRQTGARVYHRHQFTADAGTDTLTAELHDFEDGYRVVVSAHDGAVLPAPLVINQHYFVVNRTQDTLQLSDTDGGAPINLTDNGSGERLLLWWTSGSIAKDLLIDRAQGENLIYDDIQVGTPIEKRIYNNHTLSEAIAELAAASGYNSVSITETYRVQFGPRTYRPAVFGLRDYEIFDAQIASTREDFANVVHLKIPWVAFAPVEDVLVTDGVTQHWDLSALPDEIVAVFVNGEEVPFGVEGVDSAPYYWNPGELRFAQDITLDVLEATDVLMVKFHPLGGNIVSAEDAASIAARSVIEGNSGRYETTLETDEVLSVGDAQAKVAAILEARNQINTVADVTMKTQMLPAVAWARPGELVQVQIPDQGIPDSNFLIDSVDAELNPNDPDNLTYHLRLLSGERFIDDIEYFRALLADRGGTSPAGGATAPVSQIFEGGFDIAEDADITASTDIANHANVANSGVPFRIQANQKAWPAAVDTVLDVQYRTLGGTWASIFPVDGYLVIPASSLEPVVNTGFEADMEFIAPAYIRLDLISGIASGLNVKLNWRRPFGTIGNLLNGLESEGGGSQLLLM